VRSLTVAAVQCASAYLDPVANASLTEGHIRAAAAQGAQLVVLPELVASSYAPGAENFTALAESANDPGECLSTWMRLAAELNVGVIAGFLERSGDQVFNSAVVVDPEGHILDVYRKLHLFGAEHKVFAPGDRGLPIVEIHGARVGVQVCYDLRFPQLYKQLVQQGAELLLAPSAFTHTTGSAHWEVLLRSRAIDNLAWVGAAAQGGKHSNGRRTWGHSMWVDPWGQVQAVHEEGEACVLTELSIDQLRERRQQLPLRRSPLS